MRCSICNGKIIKKNETVTFHSKTIGEVFIPNIRHKACLTCRDILISPTESKKIIAYVKEKEQFAVGKLPISDFVSLNDAAEILGVTKQAFSKNPRIRAGLIYSVSIGGRRYYNRKSVEQFKETGNGRYLIPRREFRKFKIIKTWEMEPENWISDTKKVFWKLLDSKKTKEPLIKPFIFDWIKKESVGRNVR